MHRIEFQKRELEVTGSWPPARPGMPEIPILNTPVTPRENMQAFLRGEKPLWMPSFLESKMFIPSALPDCVARGNISEAKPFPPDKLGGKDFFGVDWVYSPEMLAPMVRPGNPKVPDITEWEKYITFPDLDSYDWTGSAADNREYLDDPRSIQMVVYSGFFERLISLADMSNALVAMIDEDEQAAVHRLFDRLCEFYDGLFARIAKWYKPTYLWFHDD